MEKDEKLRKLFLISHHRADFPDSNEHTQHCLKCPHAAQGHSPVFPRNTFPVFCFVFSKSNSAHSIEKHLAQLDSTAAAIGAPPNLMAETESTRDFGLEKLFRGVTEFKITSLLVQSTSQFAHGPRPGPGRKKLNFTLPAFIDFRCVIVQRETDRIH